MKIYFAGGGVSEKQKKSLYPNIINRLISYYYLAEDNKEKSYKWIIEQIKEKKTT